ncbi:hypothetical protein D9M68_296290 [compost metagenome]
MNRKMNQLLDGQPAAPPHFTEKQGQYLAFIWAYSQINERAPAERDLQRYFGVTPPSVHQMVLSLERAGLIRRKPGVARSIELLISHNCLPTLQPNQLVKSFVQRY